MHPALRGELSTRGDGCTLKDGGNQAVLQALYTQLREAFPEAGQPYWSVRCWTLLTWQPTYLSIIGVHGVGMLPPLSELRQKLGPGMVAGFCLPENAWQRGSVPALVESGGRSLRVLCDSLWSELNGITRLRRRSALRLMADSLLAAISRLGAIRPGIGQARMLELASLWLKAADLEGQSALMPVPLRNGSQPLALNRKGCCMHYRRRDGAVCASCPKQKLPVRVQRLQEELECSM